ncbi:MAG TPA: hypothetical protein PLQ76_09800 [bacterium]|nr:hypothetical protein [bacterium]
MRFKIEHRFEGAPIDAVLEFLTEEFIFDANKLPNVQGSKLLEEKITEDMKYWRNEWCAHGQIPKIVQHIIQPKMLTWVEETTYYRKKKEYYTKITPFFFRNVFKCENKGYFVRVSDHEVKRVQEGLLEIKIPVFGQMIEETIISHLRKNFDEEYKVSSKIVKEKFGV